MNLDYEQSLKMGGGGKRRNTTRTEMDEETLRKSQRRAKKIIRQKILTFQADRLLTLTYRENMSDLSTAWKHFNAFNRLMKWRYKENWQYVCVPEYQKRGAVHFHLAVKGYFHANTVRKFWKQAIKGEGNIDISSPTRRNGSVTRSPKKIAGYISKYLTKQDSTEFNKRRYSSSALQLPPIITGWLALGVPVIQVLMSIVSAQTRKAASVFEADGYLPLVIVST
ncbi:MAG: hypothetical protein KZQ77_15450 [Candidatus Thiodiazotropha sp. (ex Notomyrtea botanica)]|nr:hypothetical protein [Candidatus Thiodiazotropha sp. (ex Notomyrtea botanica)]